MQAIAVSAQAGPVGSQHSTLYINATVNQNCLISDATLAFGTIYVLAGSPSSITYPIASASVDIPYACTNGSPASIWAASNAVTLTGTGTAGHTLLASLYTEGTGTTGYPTSATAGVAVTGNGTAATSPIYGQIQLLSSTVADTYSGTTQLTISY